MNVLPLVISFLIILGITASQLFHGRLATAVEKKNIEGYLNARRKIWNKHQQASYRKKKGEVEVAKVETVEAPAEKKESVANDDEEKEEESVQKKYFRDKRCVHESGKFNLYPLLHDPDSVTAKHFYEPAAALIRHLYAQTPLWKEGQDLEYQILDGLMQKKDLSFYDAFAEKPELAPIFYKMLKGTNTYETETPDGIPPFFDFFRDDDSLKHKIDFRHAPKAVLKVLLEDALWGKIELLEKKENKPLLEKEFDPLLETFPQKKSQLQQLNLFTFGDKRSADADIAMDGTTGITIKR